MAPDKPRTAAERLRAQAEVLQNLADRYEQPSRSLVRLEMLIGEVEQAAFDIRAIVRGG